MHTEYLGKKLMILGAGQLQVPLITYAKKLGLNLTIISPELNEPGVAFADEAIQLDVRDEARILAAARHIGIDGVVTDQTDLAVRTVAYVADKMGLPGMDYELSKLFTDKFLMREKAFELGVPCPKYKLVNNMKEAREFYEDIGGTMILKPIDSQASHGVAKIKSQEDIVLYFEDFQYDERLSASQDYELWSRVIWNKRFANIPEVLLNYRIHDGQTKFKNGLKQKAGAIQARKQMLEKLRVTSEDNVGIFNWLCAVGVQRTKAELKKIENSLISILNANKEWKIFDDDTLRQLCGEYFFLNWYFSLADKSVGIKDMRNSPFSYVMRRKGIDVKMKILYKYAIKKFGGGYEGPSNIFKNRHLGGLAYV